MAYFYIAHKALVKLMIPMLLALSDSPPLSNFLPIIGRF
ncbi:hypothetical protein EFM7_1376 [Enterococcus faecalis M7]|nr:hypothetical protein OG1X_2348 [Enterococcus faecalis OG1X]ELA05389.1 hypothetical protein EFM7_1376 [Enterococcus faecalis M7]